MRGWQGLIVLAIATVSLCGCGQWRPIEPTFQAVQEEADVRVVMLDLPLKLWLRIPSHQATRLDSGLLQARMKIENFMDTDRWVDIQVIFRDKDGFEVEKTNWEPIFLHRRRVSDYQINSLGPRPMDYRILIRDPKG